MKVWTYVEPWSTARICLMFGLLAGAIIFVGTLLLGKAASALNAGSGDLMIMLGLGYLVMAPLLALVGGAVFAWFYNIFAGWVGGIKYKETEVGSGRVTKVTTRRRRKRGRPKMKK